VRASEAAGVAQLGRRGEGIAFLGGWHRFMAQRRERPQPIFRTDDNFDDLDQIEVPAVTPRGVSRPASPAHQPLSANDAHNYDDSDEFDELELPRTSTYATTEASPLTYDTARAAASTYRAPRDPLLRTYRFAIFVAVLCIAAIVLTQVAWQHTLDIVATTAAELAGREGDGQTQLTVTIALATIALLGFVIAWGAATHPRRAVRLSGDRGRMSVDAVAGALRNELLELRDVREATVAVENKGGGKILVRAWLHVGTDSRIDDTLDQVDDTTEWLVHQQLGLILAEPPLLDVRYDELDLRAARRRVDELAKQPRNQGDEGEEYE